jgi:hypothetical protein
VLDVEVIRTPAAAATALEPVRSRLLSELAKPASAATLAARLGMARQKVNELVRVARTRKWGGLTERLLVASASSYVVSPEALGPAGVDPGQTKDRLSASYLIALAARAVREVGRLLRGAEAAGQKLATLSIDTEIRFRSPGERAAFTRELTEAVMSLVRRYHDAAAADGRPHRLVVLAYPILQVEDKP